MSKRRISANRSGSMRTKADMTKRCSEGLLLADLNNVSGSLWLAVRGPCLHQLATLLQSVAAAVRLFGLVSDNVRQRGLCDFAREAGDFARPIPEAGASARSV
jgi:hypothetical protein